uniref:Uncharacterized protein n=1 Tax=Cacopsylla melanoneura TaxID=428564 RepID=A0A8D9AR64_9HEMI
MASFLPRTEIKSFYFHKTSLSLESSIFYATTILFSLSLSFTPYLPPLFIFFVLSHSPPLYLSLSPPPSLPPPFFNAKLCANKKLTLVRNGKCVLNPSLVQFSLSNLFEKKSPFSHSFFQNVASSMLSTTWLLVTD